MIAHRIEPAFYREQYGDLQHLTDEALRDHFVNFGRLEGRIASPFALRENISRLVGPDRKVLEIGPYLWPTLAGPNVKYFDILDEQALKEKALAAGYEVKTCPKIDFISPLGDLTIIDETFDAALSSHAIEHQLDLIGHFIQVARLLEDGGLYYLIIPDKRFCFDHFIDVSTVADVVEAHLEPRSSHRLKSVIEHRALTTHNDATRHWRGDHADPNYAASIAPRVRAGIAEYQAAAGGYVDVHAWQFTPDSFRQLVSTIASAGLIPLEVREVHNTPRNRLEFIAVLGKRAKDKTNSD